MSRKGWEDDREPDPWTTPSGVAWVKHVLTDMAPKMRGSALTISIAPTQDGKYQQGDVKYWVELGASIMMDKPIIVVVMADTELPERLVRVADEIVRLPDGVNPEGSQQLMEAIKRVQERLGL